MATEGAAEKPAGKLNCGSNIDSAVSILRYAMVAAQAKEMSGKSQFPFMIDPNNNDKQMLESDAIISYLWNEYGDGQVCTFPALIPRYP